MHFINRCTSKVIAALHYNNGDGVINRVAESEVFGCSLSRIPNNTTVGVGSDFFVRLQKSNWIIFYITLLSWKFRKGQIFYLRLLNLGHSFVCPLCLCFIKVNVLTPSSVYVSTAATYISSYSFMYLCVPCHGNV